MSPTVTGGRGTRRGRPSPAAPERGKRWVPKPLPRGRHRLPQDAVRASQPDRLLRAMGELAGERGYDLRHVPLRLLGGFPAEQPRR